MKQDQEETVREKVPFITSFLRSQMTSIIATTVDFLTFIFCKEIMAIYYVTASAIGSISGAFVSFTLGRNWAFRNKEGHLTYQAFKYLLTSATSLALNTYGIYFLSEYYRIDEVISKILIALLVGVFFNFLMYRYFVYK